MNRFILIISAAIFFTCSGDEPEPPVATYLRVFVAPNYHPGSDSWIIIHDVDGKLIESRALKVGDFAEFKAAILPRDFTVTILTVVIDGITLKPTITTYMAQRPRQEWTLRNTVISDFSGPIKGEFTAIIPLNEVSPVNHPPALTDRFAASAAYTEFEGNVRLIKNIFADGDDLLLVATDLAGEPRYKYFPDAAPGEYHLSIDDLEKFPSTAKITFPPSDDVSLMMKGYDLYGGTLSSRGYLINHYNRETNPATISSLTVGYLDWLANYRTTFSARYNDKVLDYQSIGLAKNEEIIINDFITTISNRTFGEFSLQGTDYNWYQASWSNAGSDESLDVTWNIEGPFKVFPNSALTLPGELLAKYPQLNDVQYDFNNVRIFRGTVTYNTYLDEKLRGNPIGYYELFSKTFY